MSTTVLGCIPGLPIGVVILVIVWSVGRRASLGRGVGWNVAIPVATATGAVLFKVSVWCIVLKRPGVEVVGGMPIWVYWPGWPSAALLFGGATAVGCGAWFLRGLVPLVASLFARDPEPGRCATCGYDVRECGDVCPECGSAIQRGSETPREYDLPDEIGG